MSPFSIAIILNSQSLIVYLKILKVIKNSISTQVGQQYFRCNYTKFQSKIPNFFVYVLNFPRVSKCFQFYDRNVRERNGTFTGVCEAL